MSPVTCLALVHVPTGYGVARAEHEKPSPKAGDDGLGAQFQALDARLTKLADRASVPLKDIVPELAKMKAVLSQRGSMSNREQRRQYGYALISWSAYAENYAERLSKSFRTIQRWIAEYDGRRKPVKREKTGINLRPAQQKALIRAQQAANELVDAWDAGADVDSAVKAYKKVAVSPPVLDDFYNRVTEPAGEVEAPKKAEPTASADEVYARLAPLMLEAKYLIARNSESWSSVERLATRYDIPGWEFKSTKKTTARAKAHFDRVVSIRDPKGLLTKMIKEGTALRASWVCFPEPSGDVVECLVIGKEIGDDYCTKVRRVKAK